jgi:hypothetical protein
MGWSPPDGSLDAIEAYCHAKLARFQGGQDRDHAEAGIRAALEAARAGDASGTIAGLNEVKKTLEMHAHYF